MTPAPARSLLLSLALGAAALALGGCGGFTPLYAAQGVSPKLAAIEVSRPDGRTGYLMGEALNDEFARDLSQPPVYRLQLKTKELRIPRGIRVNNVASRYELDVTANWTLVEIATGKTITKGQVMSNVSYDSADQPYAGLAAEQDGQQRAAGEVATRIRIALAAYFASPGEKPANAQTVDADMNAATYSERLQPATVLSPRERALGQPTPQAGQSDILGQPLRSTTTSPDDQRPTFSPSQDPNNKDPSNIQTLPTEGDQ